jgi:hypothetical protein
MSGLQDNCRRKSQSPCKLLQLFLDSKWIGGPWRLAAGSGGGRSGNSNIE